MWSYMVAMTEADAERGDFIGEFYSEEDARRCCWQTGARFILDCWNASLA